MSERELRQGINCHLCPEEAECGLCDRAREALSADPDLVELLRKLRDWLEQMTISNKTGYILCPDTLRHVQELIEKTVRLTDDGGWKWVGEAEDAE